MSLNVMVLSSVGPHVIKLKTGGLFKFLIPVAFYANEGGWVGPSKHNCRRVVFIG